jgi:hypothetical protein
MSLHLRRVYGPSRLLDRRRHRDGVHLLRDQPAAPLDGRERLAEETKACGGGPFFALREFIEPSAENIRHIQEEQQSHAQREAPGEKPDDNKSAVQ